MIDITENNKETLYEMLHQKNTITDEDLNNFYYYFNELLEASLVISYEISIEAEQTQNMKLKIQAEGFDNIIKKCHKEILNLKEKYKWNTNIGEELQ